MILKTLLIIDRRLDRHRVADEECIAYLHARHEIIVIVVEVHQLTVGSEEDAVLGDIISSTDTCIDSVTVVLIALMIVASLSQHHQIIGEEVAYLTLDAKGELPVTTIVHVEARQ